MLAINMTISSPIVAPILCSFDRIISSYEFSSGMLVLVLASMALGLCLGLVLNSSELIIYCSSIRYCVYI